MQVVSNPRVDDLQPLGVMPPVGHAPTHMYAWVIRRERFGPPRDSFALEVVETPRVGPDEVLVYVMAAGINYNGVWAGLGRPLDVISARTKKGSTEDYHIAGSDASGIVFEVGPNVSNVKVGDEVVLHGGQWDPNCAHIREGVDPILSPTFKAWGYESNFGSFAQYCRVQSHQCVPKPPKLSWAAAAAYMTSAATAHRMLYGWPPHTLNKNDVVLVWGGAGGLGCMGIQLARLAGARAVAVVSSDTRVAFCEHLGAVGCIDRRKYSHWGRMPEWKDTTAYEHWLESGPRQFLGAISNAAGERVKPRIVFEHPGEDTMPTSLFVCDRGGMVVTCAGTSGYAGTIDLRYLWMHQKRLQGSHFASSTDINAVNELVTQGDLDPCLGLTFAFRELPLGHQLMFENRHPYGNLAVLVNAT